MVAALRFYFQASLLHNFYLAILLVTTSSPRATMLIHYTESKEGAMVVTKAGL